ncbi:MAG: hypothetical protein CL489_10235 [Acidobacteria bacterium]|nr:hypothetical protein [Acidobacteriota bacterium]|tara:strand:+ start:4676 stop:4921 length:246 start_codon:yes stop_codon:yes gene_type:complete
MSEWDSDSEESPVLNFQEFHNNHQYTPDLIFYDDAEFYHLLDDLPKDTRKDLKKRFVRIKSTPYQDLIDENNNKLLEDSTI